MRYIRALVLAAVVAASLTASSPAHAQVKAWSICKYQLADGKAGWSPKEVRRTIRCATNAWPVPGGFDRADYIAYRESRYQQFATNGSCLGIYQWYTTTWEHMLDEFPRVAAISTSRYNARANVLMAIRFAHKHGWGPWAL